jgi:hypothetical protein
MTSDSERWPNAAAIRQQPASPEASAGEALGERVGELASSQLRTARMQRRGRRLSFFPKLPGESDPPPPLLEDGQTSPITPVGLSVLRLLVVLVWQ